MTQEQIKNVAFKYEAILADIGIETIKYDEINTPKLKTEFLEHAAWMLGEIPEHLNNGHVEKAHRWLGFVQGIFWTLGILNINDMKNDNR
jgi:hypothetical protein